MTNQKLASHISALADKVSEGNPSEDSDRVVQASVKGKFQIEVEVADTGDSALLTLSGSGVRRTITVLLEEVAGKVQMTVRDRQSVGGLVDLAIRSTLK